MNNDPDVDAMANSPIAEADDDPEYRQMTVIEGGASGGLFLPDDETDDETLERAQREADVVMTEADDESGSHAQRQLMHDTDPETSEDESESEEDGEDPIVKSYDIFATKRLGEHLYYFQYPIRPPNRPYDNQERPMEARMKPHCGNFELEIPITESAYYDQQRATQWTEESLRKQTIGGSISAGRHYLVGLFRDDELHVTPLKGVIQLRPNFKYIDVHDREEKDAKKAEAMAEKGQRAPKAVQVSAKSADAVPDLSTTSLIRAAEEENWTKLQWRDAQHKDSQNVFNHLITNKKNILCESLTDKTTYLDMLSTVHDAAKPVLKSVAIKKEA